MKNQIQTAVFVFGVFFSLSLSAQQTDLTDQNPNYAKSMEKYMTIKDDLLKTQSTTLQNTYKAIDDIELKKERRALKRSNRHERRLARINNRGYYFNDFYNYTPYNYYWSGYRPYANYSRYNNPYCGLNVATDVATLGLYTYWLLR